MFGLRFALAGAAVAAAAMLLAGCSDGNFSQYPGFDEIRAGLSSEAAAPEEQRLLQRYKPRLFIAPNGNVPLDFYGDYIARGRLEAGGETIRNPTAAQLNAHRDDPAAAFTHEPDAGAPATPVAYGAVSYADIDWPLVGKQRLTFLSYHFAFRRSGLPAGTGAFWRALAGLFADNDDWHQLDHYTAAFVVLIGGEPAAVMLQQHNNMRTYIIGEADFPAGDALALDAAVSSNELYPRGGTYARHAAVNFMNAGTINHLLELEEGSGWQTSYDITDGRREVNYALKYLPANDAFYTFQGWLGERRLLPGRDGPPGAIYRAPPALWPPHVALYVFYWRPGDEEYAAIVRREKPGALSAEARALLRRRLAAALQNRPAR